MTHAASRLVPALAFSFAIALIRQASAAPLPCQVPAGFEIELVAGPPLIEHPTMAGFDDQGRLYVCDGPGSNLPAKELLATLPHRIVRLEDSDGDGRFDRSTVFADKLTFPMGALWYRGSVYTASPPYIWKLTDADGDGVAEQREKLISEFGFTGNAADIHGCFLSPDGRIFWCDGRHGHTFVDEQGHTISKGLAARVFSCRPDGTDVESFAGGGMDNPVEVTFTREGEVLGTVAIFDVYEGRHDALVHWVYGGAYPRSEQPCVQEFRRTGDLLPPLARWGQVAPSGVERYRAEAFGPDYRDNTFTAQFDTHCVVRSKLERQGATYRSVDEDFVTSTSQDFHPTDAVLDADGSLLVIDTGGWFRIGCPLSQIAKPEVKGAIYRVRRQGAKPPSDPWGLSLAWSDAQTEELVLRLADARFAVVERSVDALAGRGDAAVEALRQARHHHAENAAARGQAVWALARIGTAAARQEIRAYLPDKDASVRQIAVHACGTLRDAEALDMLCELIESGELPIRREAATALGRIGSSAAVPALLAALATSSGDRFFEHALVYALIQIKDRPSTAVGLKSPSAATRRGALIALDQMPEGQLAREEVTSLLDTDDVALQKAAIEIIGQHPGWAAELAGLFDSWLAQPMLGRERAGILRTGLAGLAREPKLQVLIASRMADPQTSLDARLLLLEVVGQAELGELPPAWNEQLAQALQSSDARVVRQALTAVATRGSNRFDDQLHRIAREQGHDPATRLAAAVLVARHGQTLDAMEFELLLASLAPDVAPADRLAAAEGLGLAKLEAGQRKALLGAIERAGPLELSALVQAFERQREPTLDRALVDALVRSQSAESVSLEQLRKLLEGASADVLAAAAPLVRRASAGLEEQKARLDELRPLMAGGDPARGKAVFFSSKAACSACHRLKDQGALIGPDLTAVGRIRAPSDLLEAVVFPSASLARGYETVTIVTGNGQTFTGILSRQTPEAVYLRTAQREELRIDRRRIEQMVPGKVSIMPQGFDKLLTPAELRDLFALLESLKGS